MPTELELIADPILRRFDSLNALRDRALNEGRQIIRLSANGVRAIHRHELQQARRLIDEAGGMLGKLVQDLDEHPGIRWAGYTQDAMKEYAEASILLAIVAAEPLPTPESLAIDDAPYLNALAEAASELRRSILDALRANKIAESEDLLATMDDIYSTLITVDYPDGLTGGLRRSTDALRAVLERTRGDLTLTTIQHRLQVKIDAMIESETD